MSEHSEHVSEIQKEVPLKTLPGMPMLLLTITFYLLSVILIVFGVSSAINESAFAVAYFVLSMLLLFAAILLNIGIKIVKPNEAAVFTLFGKYLGVLKTAGFYWINPFASAVSTEIPLSPEEIMKKKSSGADAEYPARMTKKMNRISLKKQTLDNGRQKINDEMGNPIEIGIVVIWQVENTYKAVFNVDDYRDYLSIQADSALRDIVRMYPYDVSGDDNEKTLRGSSMEISQRLKEQIQEKADDASLKIVEARITHLAYALEIAAAMLQRQQASAIIDARQMIVEGAVGMVDMALKMLSEGDIVELDDERKAQMVSNLLVVLCGNRDAQPIVNSGSIY
jgi:regulator of protease activity HflC (stomatin/prohibitin superfamily)